MTITLMTAKWILFLGSVYDNLHYYSLVDITTSVKKKVLPNYVLNIMTKIKMLQIVLMNNHVLFCFINLVLNENVLAPSLEQELVFPLLPQSK